MTEVTQVTFTIATNSPLARAIRERSDPNMTLQIVAHNSTWTDIQAVIVARLMKWTIHAGCAHTPETMELEWEDPTRFLEFLTVEAPWSIDFPNHADDD